MLRNHTFLVSVFVALFSLVLSSPAEAKGPHSAKPVVSILGDSYSTFKGYIPDSYACWYDTTPLTDKIQAKKTDVNDVKQTWWWQLINDGGYILGVNDSYSGATISFVRSSHVCRVLARPTFCSFSGRPMTAGQDHL